MPYWPAVTDEALREPASLARALASMGFDIHCGTVPRGSIVWWRPAYAAGKPARLHGFAALNRALRDADVHLLASGDTITAVSAYDGAWRSADGAQRGDDLPSLGALRWAISYGKAAFRLARIIGLDIPRLEQGARAHAR